MTKNNNKTCGYPDRGVYITPTGDIGPCCAIDKSFLKPFSNISQIGTDPVYKELKDLNSKGNILESEACKSCKFQEGKNIISLRQLYKQHYNPKQNYEDNKFKYDKLDISFGNTCNLDCVMCTPYYSSTWYQTYKNNDTLKNFLDATKSIKITGSKPKLLNYDQIDEILKITPYTRAVVIKGGEPLYDKRCFYFLEKLSVLNPDIKLNIVTNLTVLNIDLIKKFKNINLVVSVDGIGKIYEWIRGTSYTKVENNIKILQENNIKFQIQPTLSVYNIEHMEYLYRYFSARKIKIRPCPIVVNDYYMIPELIGKKRFRRAVKNFSFNLDIEYKEPSDDQIKKFKKYTDLMNSHRGFNWEEIACES